MGIMVFSLLCVMQDLSHQPCGIPALWFRAQGSGSRALGFGIWALGFRV